MNSLITEFQATRHPEIVLHKPKRSHSARFLIWAFPASSLFVCALIIAPFWFRGREESRNIACESNLFGIGDLLRAYYGRHGTYPPLPDEETSGAAPVSWRVVTQKLPPGPDLDGYDLKQTWNSSQNKPFVTSLIGRHFSCHSDSEARRDGKTSYLAVIGKGTV